VGSLHCWAGMGRERGERGIFQVSLLIESWLASNNSTSGRDPTSNHLPLPFLVNLSCFGSVQSHPPAAIIGLSLSKPMHHLRLPTWLAILAALVPVLEAKTLYHRIYHPTQAPAAQFSLRGTLRDGAVVDASSLETDLASFSKFISQLDRLGQLDEALYQLAFERESNMWPEDRLLSSVKAVSPVLSMITRYNHELIHFLGESDSATCMPRLMTLSSFIWLAMANHLLSTISFHPFRLMVSVLLRRRPRLN